MAEGKITTGSTVTFRLDADKDDVPWDLDTPSVAVVRLYLTGPEDAEVTGSPFTATNTTPDSGIADYTVATTVLDEPGVWTRQWRVTQGSVDIWGEPIKFHVYLGG